MDVCAKDAPTAQRIMPIHVEIHVNLMRARSLPLAFVKVDLENILFPSLLAILIHPMTTPATPTKADFGIFIRQHQCCEFWNIYCITYIRTTLAGMYIRTRKTRSCAQARATCRP